jgi:hypothetical protein
MWDHVARGNGVGSGKRVPFDGQVNHTSLRRVVRSLKLRNVHDNAAYAGRSDKLPNVARQVGPFQPLSSPMLGRSFGTVRI